MKQGRDRLYPSQGVPVPHLSNWIKGKQ